MDMILPAKISQQGLVIGNINAPITSIEFINLRCPYSKAWFELAASILEPAVAAGRVKRIFKLFDKPKESLLKGNLAQHHLPYDQPEQAYAAIKFLFAHQNEWGENLTDTEIDAYIEHQLGLPTQPNQTMIDLVLNEAKTANVQFVPTIIIGDTIFDEKITKPELAKLIA
ncbi:thioredoxin domain-containing protein [Loigolactobacillus zhaoyuanensis]|uniref:Thioredoxin domain-containing protein n=1 Tax=Loigolactobacillus zhaoyuanensis TaxID=2486017 RepID=A0ABW8UA77_9LACO|nr:thioredoxin domain-containing protein [Loigolactobacillus zhaoyuanensis]